MLLLWGQTGHVTRSSGHMTWSVSITRSYWGIPASSGVSASPGLKPVKIFPGFLIFFQLLVKLMPRRRCHVLSHFLPAFKLIRHQPQQRLWWFLSTCERARLFVLCFMGKRRRHVFMSVRSKHSVQIKWNQDKRQNLRVYTLKTWVECLEVCAMSFLIESFSGWNYSFYL